MERRYFHEKVFSSIGRFSCCRILHRLSCKGSRYCKSGLISVLSGPLAVIGNGEAWSAEMAVKDFGTVLGKKIEFVTRDHAYNPGLANEKAKELYEKENVDVIVGWLLSGRKLGGGKGNPAM